MSGTTDRTILFADLSGFTALAEAHGDLDAADVAFRFVALARDALRGEAWILKGIGDAVLVLAATTSAGLDTALALVEAIESEHAFPGVAIGIHAGPVVERDGDVFGAAVNLAARVAERASAGQILCTEAFAREVPADRRDLLRAAGSARFRNIVEPVTLYEIRWSATAGVEVVDPVCRMRLDPARAAAVVRWAGRDWYVCSPECARALRARPEAYLGPT